MAVLGSSQLIARHTQDEKSLDYCGRIDTAVHHLTGVLDEILDYAKYEANEIKLHKQPLDVAAELRGAVNLLAGTADQAGVALRYDVAPNLPLLYADRVRLRQILLNLLSNALKFTPAGGTVTVNAARTEDAQLVIRVEDTGMGISAEALPLVMQPFGQVRNARTGKPTGTGLGLPLTKGLVELHGGSLTLTSALGAGTTVTMRLPMPPVSTEASNRSRSLTSLG
jgi:two-component system, cell cycle sensor histidine kinase PleC